MYLRLILIMICISVTTMKMAKAASVNDEIIYKACKFVFNPGNSPFMELSVVACAGDAEKLHLAGKNLDITVADICISKLTSEKDYSIFYKCYTYALKSIPVPPGYPHLPNNRRSYYGTR